VRLKEIINCGADEFEISVGYHFCRKPANLTDEFLQLTINAGRTEIFEAKAVFISGFAINDEENIVDTANGTAIAIANVVVEDFAEAAGSRDWSFVSVLFGESGGFATGKDRITTCIPDEYAVLGQRVEVLENLCNIPEAKALLEELSGDQFDGWLG